MMLAKARKDGDQAAVKELEAIGHRGPINAHPYFRFSKNVRSLLWPPSAQAWLRHLRSQAAELKASDPEQFKNLEEGMEFTGKHVWPDQIATNLPKTAYEMHTAYFRIQGRADIVTPTQAAIDHFNCVKAPKKELVLVPNAGHFAFMTASHKFLRALISKVRRVALAGA